MGLSVVFCYQKLGGEMATFATRIKIESSDQGKDQKCVVQSDL